MDELTEIIRMKAKALLDNKQVDAVLGFCRGTTPMARRPFLARSPEQAELLCWDEFCLMNLANFLPTTFSGRIAVIAKGCDWRNLVVHHQEGQVNLENQLYVLGVHCRGMLDPGKINRAAGGAERVLKVVIDNEDARISLVDGELLLKKQMLYRQACRDCIQSSPVTADDWLGEPVQAGSLPDGAHTADFQESGDPETRKVQLHDVFRHCLMCFACRDACPLCYCNRCFVDVEKSHWLSTQSPMDRVLDFHFFRAHHIAGRCTGCGACETACPMDIPVRQLVTKLNHDIEKDTGYIPGIKLDANPPDGVFRPSYHELSGRRK